MGTGAGAPRLASFQPIRTSASISTSMPKDLCQREQRSFSMPSGSSSAASAMKILCNDQDDDRPVQELRESPVGVGRIAPLHDQHPRRLGSRPMLTHGTTTAIADAARRARAASGAVAAALGPCASARRLRHAGCVLRRCAPEPVLLPPRPIAADLAGRPGAPAGFRVPAGARVFDIDPAQERRHDPGAPGRPAARSFGHNHVVTSGAGDRARLGGPRPGGLGIRDPRPRGVAGRGRPGRPCRDRRGVRGRGPGVRARGHLREHDAARGARRRGVPGRDRALRRPRGDLGAARRGRRPDDPRRRRDASRSRSSSSARADALVGPRLASASARSDFGITPFSVAGGAIQVGDELELRFEIVAVAR